MKIMKSYVILASMVFLGISLNSWAITPDGAPGTGSSSGERYSSPPPPVDYDSPAPSSRSKPREDNASPTASAGTKPILENPTADQVKKALGIGQPKTRDVARLKHLGFGTFILFESGSATVIPSPGLVEIKNALLDLEDDASILIVGHTDNQGGDAYNVNLSKRRAASVRRWLEEHDVRRGAIYVDGKGFHEPYASNATEAGRRLNRRVEFSRIYGEY
jgi:outer membrane protein OmpA-like peptidoglycan-associated protein